MDNAESVGKYLKKERESRNLCLEEVAKNTRISEHILAAIENDRNDLLPSATYIRGFLSAYAKSMGIDPNDVILRYQRCHEIGKTPVLESASGEKTSPKTKYRWVILVVLGGILIGLVLFYSRLPVSTPPIEPPPPKPAAKPEIKEPPPVSPPQAATPLAPQEAPFSLELKAVEETWVRIQINGHPEKEMILKPGETVSYQASDRIQLLIGNAGGLDLTFNGKALEKVGKSGEVVALIFTPRGFENKPREK
jgi:cytoskeleton protein RodZ